MNDIEKALLTWYGEDDRNYKNPRPAILGLVGEAGELIDLYKSHEYKPSFDWWDCKWCGQVRSAHVTDHLNCVYGTPINVMSSGFQDVAVDNTSYTPLVLDELGDWWYYWRILCWLLCWQGEKLAWWDAVPSVLQPEQGDILDLVTGMLEKSLFVLRDYLDAGYINVDELVNAFKHFGDLLYMLDTGLDTITDLNYHKLNAEPTNHGWKGA